MWDDGSVANAADLLSATLGFYPKHRGKQEALRELVVSEQATRRTGQITVSVEQRAVGRIAHYRTSAFIGWHPLRRVGVIGNLCDILSRLSDLGSESAIRDLLPDRWKPREA